jgi:cell division protein FtsN
LPNKEINISEWVAEDQSLPVSVNTGENSVFILQVGSFKQLEAADQVKAQLALLGIQADIQRVVINGQDTRYRVRVGPYADQSKLDQERRRLQENNLEYMLLKLQADDPRLGEG